MSIVRAAKQPSCSSVLDTSQLQNKQKVDWNFFKPYA